MSEAPENKSRGGLLVPVLIIFVGLVLVGQVATGVILYLLCDQQARHEQELSALRLRFANTEQAPETSSGKKYTGEEATVVESGKAYVDDFEKHRLLKVYHATTAEFQKKNEQDKFIKEFDQLSFMRKLKPSEREFSLRKKPKNKSYEKIYEFYFTGMAPLAARNPTDFLRKYSQVNVNMTLVEVGGEWLIDELNITHADRKN